MKNTQRNATQPETFLEVMGILLQMLGLMHHREFLETNQIRILTDQHVALPDVFLVYVIYLLILQRSYFRFRFSHLTGIFCKDYSRLGLVLQKSPKENLSGLLK